jgi:hypothetical protein
MNDAQKLGWLYDIEQIKQLKHRYCAYCDEGYDADGIAGLFVEDGVWDGGPFGTYHGRAAIHAFFAGASKLISFANHYVSNPVIDIEGDIARGRWDLWQPMVNEPAHRAAWLVAKYRDTYVRTAGGWMFERLTVDVRALSPYEEGFARQRFMT